MSHFTVLVIGDNWEDQLAPYNENLEVEPYPSYWDDEECARFLEHYKRSSMDQYQPGFAEDVRDWCGATDYGDDENGFFTMSTYNPKAKWDWYQMGGRWTGFFLPKLGKTGRLGEEGVFGTKPETGKVDQIRVGDIDLDGMMERESRTAREEWAFLSGLIKDLPRAMSFPEVLRKFEKELGGDRKEWIEKAREFYKNQPAYKAIIETELGRKLDPLFGDVFESYKLYEPEGMKKYVTMKGMSAVMTFAVVKDGEWYERGSMGWFGFSTGDKEQDVWVKEFYDLLTGLPSDTLLTVVDCHI